MSALVSTFNPAVEAKVECGSCVLCCRNQVVGVFADTGDDPSAYETETLEIGGLSLMILKRQPNGDCHYLGPTGCTIYDRRPATCRAFDCGAWFRKHTRAERRRATKDDYDRALFARGREIEAARAAP